MPGAPVRVQVAMALVSLLLMGTAAADSLADETAAGTVPLRTPESYVESWPFLRTSLEVVGVNILMTAWGRYVARPESPSYRLNIETLKSNPINGFEWDENTFFVNSFRHPYQGAQYFGAARANRYDFYQSAMWAFAGAWLFEYTGEANPPSFNDWIDTAVGGITLGEALFRLSGVVLDNSASGSSRLGRELGGFAVLPIRSVNRMVTGEAYRVHSNPPDRRPATLRAGLRAGAWTTGEGQLWNADLATAFLGIDVSYGDPFEGSVEKPFGAFTLGGDVSFDDGPEALRRLEVDGMIAAAEVGRGGRSRHAVGGQQSFDYFNNAAYSLGAHSFGASFVSSFRTSEGFETRVAVNAAGILLGATETITFGAVQRRYDRGPGADYALEIQVIRNGRRLVDLSHAGFWIHSINGNDADHFLSLTRARANVPVIGSLGVGLEYILYTADSRYAEFADTHRRIPELKLYAGWGSN